MTRILLLAGTWEARQLATALGRLPQIGVIASLAGATRTPQPLGVPTRIGGFGGRDAFATYLARKRIDGVLDATHPFAQAISHRSREVCAEMDVPYAQLLRPAWRPRPEDHWVFLNDEADAPRHIVDGSTVFLATGRQTLHRYQGLRGSTLYVRRVDGGPEPFPYPRGGWVIGRPPFEVEDEMALFSRLGVEWLVAKNAGGNASRSKLDAARALGLPVAMIRRPPQPDALRLDSIATAVLWARRLG